MKVADVGRWSRYSVILTIMKKSEVNKRGYGNMQNEKSFGWKQCVKSCNNSNCSMRLKYQTIHTQTHISVNVRESQEG